MSSHQCDGVDKGGCRFDVPGRGALCYRVVLLQRVGGQCHPGKLPHQYRRGASDGSVRPLALGFHAQVSPHLLVGDFQFPAQHKPLQDPGRSHGLVSTEQGLGVEFTLRVSDQYPAGGYGRFAMVIPDSGLGGEFQGLDGAVVPGHRCG